MAMSIMKAVVLSMENAQDMLDASAMNRNVEGVLFLRNLEELEKHTKRVRELYREVVVAKDS